MKYVLIEGGIKAIKNCGIPQYQIAQKIDIPNNVFSMVLNGLHFSDYYRKKIEGLAEFIDFNPHKAMNRVN